MKKRNMDTITLKVEPRELVGRKTELLREKGKVPAVIYGPKTEPKNISVDANALVGVYKAAGGSSLVDLVVGDAKPVKVIIQDIQRDPIKDTIIHADFFEVDMTKPVSATVLLDFVGTSPAVKELGGTLIKARNSIDVKGLPDKLVPSIEVDISALRTFDDVIHVKDLVLPEGLEFNMDPERSVAVVNPPRTEAEMKALEESPEEEVGAVEAEGEEAKEEGDAEEKPAEAEPSPEGETGQK